MSKYNGVCLPKDLLNLIDEKKGKFGYTSRADFIKQAIRRELERLNKIKTGGA